jgi:hypothetical protein
MDNNGKLPRENGNKYHTFDILSAGAQLTFQNNVAVSV